MRGLSWIRITKNSTFFNFYPLIVNLRLNLIIIFQIILSFFDSLLLFHQFVSKLLRTNFLLKVKISTQPLIAAFIKRVKSTHGVQMRWRQQWGPDTMCGRILKDLTVHWRVNFKRRLLVEWTSEWFHGYLCGNLLLVRWCAGCGTQTD